MYPETQKITTAQKRPYKYRRDGRVRNYIRSRAISRRPRRVEDVDYKYYQVGVRYLMTDIMNFFSPAGMWSSNMMTLA